MFVPLVHGAADLDRQQLEIGGEVIRLTPNETRLFRYLAQRPGQTVDHDELLREVFGYAASARSRTVFSTMQRLRKKVEPDPAEPVHLKSVYGRGYCFEPLGEEGGLLGRAEVMVALRRRLSEEGRLWVVAPGGYGKTALLRHHVEQSRSDVVWIGLTGVRTVEELRGVVCSALGIAPVEGLEALTLAMAHRAADLLVLDAGEELGEVLVPRVQALAEVVPVVVTTRIPPPDEPTLELGPLASDDARRLFVRSLPRTLDAERIEPLLERLGGVPLALELAGARLRLFSPEDLHGQLDDLGALLSGGEGRQASMEQVLAWSWRHTSADLQAALGRLAPARQGLRVGDATQLLGDGGLTQLEALCSWGWTSIEAGRVQMLDPVRQFVETRVDLAKAEAGHRQLFLERTRAREEALLVGRGKEFLDAEWANLRAALRTGWPAKAPESIELALLLVPTMGQRVAMAEALRWLDEAARIARGPVLGDVLVLRAALWMSRSSLDAAEADLRRAEEVGVRDRGFLALRWGRWQQDRLDLDASRANLERASQLLHGPWHLQAQLALAYTLVKAGQEDEALAVLRRVLARARVEDAPSPTLLALGTLGILHTQRDDFDAARQAHLEALKICEDVGSDLVAARVHTQLGAVELYRGEREAAAHHWAQGMEISRRLGARVGVAMAQVNLANLALVDRDLDRAGQLLDEASRIFEEAGFAPGLAYARLGQGRLASARGRATEAERCFDACERGLPPQLGWLVGVHRCLLRASQRDAVGAREALAAARAPTDAGSRAGLSLASALCGVLEGGDPSEVRRALASAADVRDPVIVDLADQVREIAGRVTG